jgi:hypothetical protein
MLKIGLIQSEKRQFDASSYWRGLGALALLPDVQAEQLEGIGWQTIIDKDILFFANPVTQSALEQIQYCKFWNKKIWIDFDDDHFNVPEDNDTYEIYMNPVAKRIIQSIMGLSDLLTVSSDELKIQCREYADNIHVVRNAWNTALMPLPEDLNTTKVITWRGGRTRDNDLLTVQDSIINLAKTHQDWSWNFIGSPRYFKNKGHNIVIHRPIYFGSYFHYFRMMKQSIMVVPLQENTFNLCKSNIAWIEATYCGAVTVAKEMGEFTGLPIFGYRTEKQFAEIMEYLFSRDSMPDRIELYNKSKALIETDYNLNTQNKKRIQLIYEVI